MKDSEFSNRSMKQLIKSVTEKRVSDKAGDRLGVKLEEITERISEKAIQKAESQDRITVIEKDVVEALRDVKEREVNNRLEI